MVNESAGCFSQRHELRGDEMRTPDEVAAMLRLRALGWGERRIATALGCSRRTVRRYLAAEGWVSYRRPRRSKRLEGLEAWLEERFFRHRGNADVVRQDLEREQGVTVEPAHGGAGGGAVCASRLARRGSGDASVRDAAGSAAADRLRRDAGARSAAMR